MFLIDLLKGKGKPPKNDLKRTLLKAVPFLIPVIAAIAWAASYRQDCAQVENQMAVIRNNQVIIDDSSQAAETYCRINSQLAEMRNYMETISKGLSYRVQVSDLLVEFVQILPDDIFVHEMEMNRRPTLKKIKEQGTGNLKEHLIVQRNFKLVLCGFDAVGSEEAVREYVSALKKSTVLSDIFADFKPAARQQGTVNGRSATYYEIECILRE